MKAIEHIEAAIGWIESQEINPHDEITDCDTHDLIEALSRMRMAIDELKTEWIPIDDRLPEEHDEDDCPDKYLVRVESFGIQMALFSEGRFFHNLAAPFENVISWMPLPKY